MAFDDKTDTELVEWLKSWRQQKKVADRMVYVLTMELLRRHRGEVSDGYFTDWGFVPKG